MVGVVTVVVMVVLVTVRMVTTRRGSEAAVAKTTATTDECLAKAVRAWDAIQRDQSAKKTHRAFVEVVARDVLERHAARLDAMPVERRGKLHCVLVAVKDNVETGPEWGALRTTAGSVALAGLDPPRATAPALRAVVEEGALVMGKANMDEFALGYRTLSSRGGQTRNAIDASRYPGGSSGGAAVAVALLFVDAAIATDTGGSVRIPSAFNGVVGLRPTTGVVSVSGVVPLSHSRDTVGPIARSVGVVRLMFEAMRGTACPDSASSGRWRSGDKQKPRIGVLRGLFVGDSSAEADAANTDALERGESEAATVSKAVREALTLVAQSNGAELVEVDVPSATRDALAKHKSTSSYEFAADLEAYLGTRTPRLSVGDIVAKIRDACASGSACYPIVADMEKRVGKPGASVPASAKAEWKRLAADVAKAMDAHGVDALAFPAFAAFPSKLTSKRQTFCPNNRLAASTGMPALTLPVSTASSGSVSLPVGMELLARANEDCHLLRVAEVVERGRARL